MLVAVAILGYSRLPFRLVLGDASLVLELGQQSRKLRDLLDDSAHARQLIVRLIDRIGPEPLHGSTIARKAGAAPTLHGVESDEARERLAASIDARLATVSDDGKPHIVPMVFALDGDTIYFAVDAKPKKSTNLKRLKNIAANPAVSVLVDHYEDDWSKLWWVRADGTARVITDNAVARHATDLLADRYMPYRSNRPEGPVVAIHIERLTGWSGS
jgi:PPOX class probable F420-dependent enzyme